MLQMEFCSMFFFCTYNLPKTSIPKQNPHRLVARKPQTDSKELFYSRTISKIFTTCFLLVLFILMSGPIALYADTGDKKFPEYPSIRNNIKFWEKIYSFYSVNSAVIHDKNDVTKIYTVITLMDKDLPHARDINEKRIKQVEEKYARILLRLAGGSNPATKDEFQVAAMFKGPGAAHDMRIAAENIRSQNGLKERFYEGVIRSVAYFKKLQHILESYGVPGELAYLPHVESSFNPRAYSKSGAAGIWQFTRSTGKQYMTINHHVDQRRDPFISTRAAAKVLKKNYEALGSWPLAITAYNYGFSGMMRATKSHGDYIDIFKHYHEGYFKFASRNFYSEFLAARKVAKNLVGTHLASTAAAKPSTGKTPVRLIKQVQSKVIITQQLRPTKPKRIVSRHHFYTVKKGDTASSIAAAHNVSVHRLCKENNLGPKAVIRIGQNLKIPLYRSNNGEKTSLQTSADSGRRSADTKKRMLLHSLCRNIPAPSNKGPDNFALCRIDIT